MIVQAVKKQTLDVEIDPSSVIENMREAWKIICRLPIDAELRSGYWTREERMGHNTETVRLRLATQREIRIYEAFETMQEVAEYFE